MTIRKLLLFTITVSLFACTPKQENVTDKQGDVNEAFLTNVKTIKATSSNQEEELMLSGKVEYDPDKVVRYTPLISGIINRTYFSLGDKVQKGQTLLDIGSPELSSLQSEYISAEAEVKVAERDLQTAQSMYEDKMMSEKDLLSAQAKLKQAKALLSKSKSDLSPYSGMSRNGTFTIKAPMSGYIVEKNISAGSPVSGDSEPLFVIADLSTIWVMANVYAGNLQFVKEGMDVEITTLSYPGEVFSGKINGLSQVFDSEEKVLKARIILPNKDLRLKPEMSVVVKLKSEALEKLISIPTDALIFDDNRYFVVVEKTSNNFEIREVGQQGHNNTTTYIRSGLNDGENVVIKNQLLIYSKLKED